jgi:hypothetical protein
MQHDPRSLLKGAASAALANGRTVSMLLRVNTALAVWKRAPAMLPWEAKGDGTFEPVYHSQDGRTWHVELTEERYPIRRKEISGVTRGLSLTEEVR